MIREQRLVNIENQARIPNHPLAGMWLVRRSLAASDGNHFSSVMDLPKRAAERIFSAAGKDSDGDYIAEREICENWLRRRALQHGLTVPNQTPLYFRLLARPLVVQQEPFIYINIPADTIPVGSMTFTLEDSFHHLGLLTGNPHAHTPSDLKLGTMTAHDVRRMTAGSGIPDTYQTDQNHYIESQVWGRPTDIPGLDLAATVMSALGTRMYDQGHIIIGE